MISVSFIVDLANYTLNIFLVLEMLSGYFVSAFVFSSCYEISMYTLHPGVNHSCCTV